MLYATTQGKYYVFQAIQTHKSTFYLSVTLRVHKIGRLIFVI